MSDLVIKDKKISKIKIIIIVLMALVLIGGATYAMISGVTITNGDYSYHTACFDVSYDITNDDGTSDIVGTLMPSEDYMDGLSGGVSIGLDPKCNVGGLGNLYLKMNDNGDASKLTEEVLPHCENGGTLETLTEYVDETTCTTNLGTWVTNGSALKYVVYDEKENFIASVGYINKVRQNINIYKQFDVVGEHRYKIYIWLDGNLVDNSYMGLSLRGSISADVMQTDSFVSTIAHPVLDDGMIPVTIANDGTVITVDENDKSWYDYENKKWANVVLVKEDISTPRQNYLNNPGTIVDPDDILAYYTWIPRFKYRIPEMICGEILNPTPDTHPECFTPYIISDTDKASFISGTSEFFSISTAEAESITNIAIQTGVFTIPVEGSSLYFSFSGYVSYLNSLGSQLNYEAGNLVTNKITNGVKTIDVLFQSYNDLNVMGDAVNTYRTHPAFNSNVGMWVGKFETTGDTTTPTILPNSTPLTNQNISTQFATLLKFAGGTQSGSSVSFAGNNTYGLSNDSNSHMMKNSEWGAVVYLSHSKYGINNEIRINNYYNNGYKTGCGAINSHGAVSSSCEITYGDAGSYPQSTTGNITGVFDMSGGAFEYVMGNYNGVVGSSGFTTLPTVDFYDKYTSDNISTACDGGICYGHALSETQGWYTGVTAFVNQTNPWIYRGGTASQGSTTSAFLAYLSDASANADATSRSVLYVPLD